MLGHCLPNTIAALPIDLRDSPPPVNGLPVDLGADLMADLRPGGPLGSVIAKAMQASGIDADEAKGVVTGVFEAQALREAREAKHAGRHTRTQRRVLARRDEPAVPTALPQIAKPPPHVKHDHKREAEAERAAKASAWNAGRRELVFLPAWCRAMARRCAVDRAAATRELCHVPRTVADSIRASAAPYGGLDSAAGRNVVGLAVVFYWLAKRLRGRISGLSRAAWASLTVGSHGKHYSTSALFHPYHRHDESELDPSARGVWGGRVGVGDNRGLVRAIESEGWLRVIVPDAELAPGWMVAPSGWAFVQVLVTEPDPGDNSS
jgi:hypothetical protein